MKEIKIIGLGGVGTYLCEGLSRFLNYEDPDSNITLIDGDAFELKNFQRQIFDGLGKKAQVKYIELNTKYTKINFNYVAEYVNNENISELIKNGDIVFLCVDNHNTRKLISNYAEKLQDVVIISGGNEYLDGNVQIYVRKGGENITASLTDYHPEIAEPRDVSPEHLSCEELSKSAPQLLFTNMTVAVIMCWMFYKMIGLNQVTTSCAEVYFDITSMSVLPKDRKPKK